MASENLPNWFILVFEQFQDIDEDKLKSWIDRTDEEYFLRILRSVRLIAISRYLSELQQDETDFENIKFVDLTSLRLSLLVVAIESLGSSSDYQDFFKWFISNKFSKSEITISKEDFISNYNDYKSHFGSYRLFKRFIDNYFRDENLNDEYFSVESLMDKYSGEEYSREMRPIKTIKKKKNINSSLEEAGLTFDETIKEIYDLRSKYFHKGEAGITDRYNVSKIKKIIKKEQGQLDIIVP